ncbi:MAG: hypothetical protein VX740_07765 [Pseudomonadota bacterium]|jgi:hypothetical protein|nr:hypothetical protein [Pseudomonadota bacterium]MED5423321.1 hypothetical protein [Pseudomonadota bacterium]
MKKDFMNAARKIGTFLAASVMALSVSFGAQAQDELKFPSFPASFETATYQGQQGCIPNDDRYEFAVMKNEGMERVGGHPLLETRKDGLHVMSMMYNAEKGYGYTLSIKGDGMICVADKYETMKFSDELSNVFTTVANVTKSPLTPADCEFADKAVNICASYEALTAKLINGGYHYDWQGQRADGKTVTMMSGADQSFQLMTDNSTGATIITGIGKGEFGYFKVPDQDNKSSTPNYTASLALPN